MATAKQQKPNYQNNPFFVATDGLTLLFKKAMPVAILAIVLACLSLFGNMAQTAVDISTGANSPSDERMMDDKASEQTVNNFFESISREEVAVFVGVGLIVLLVLIFVSTLIAGVFDYTAAQLAKGKTVTLQEALKGVLRRFFGYLWLNILIGIKVFLWSLLLIVPGIIMAVRYSLSGAAFFEKGLGANAATKHSSRLVKGAWLTTFSSFALFNIVTLGMLQAILQPGTVAVLYRQLNAFDAAKAKKPAAHVLSWLTLLIPLGLLVLLLLVGGLVAYVSYIRS
ncbi:MAG: hypothetical protein JWM00_374 [Candidatus Saccharibacteria bacterium]|nr:hypothetical protein [Candidatus Saccharibacteria bacterium]